MMNWSVAARLLAGSQSVVAVAHSHSSSSDDVNARHQTHEAMPREPLPPSPLSTLHIEAVLMFLKLDILMTMLVHT